MGGRLGRGRLVVVIEAVLIFFCFLGVFRELVFLERG